MLNIWFVIDNLLYLHHKRNEHDYFNFSHYMAHRLRQRHFLLMSYFLVMVILPTISSNCSIE